MSSIVNLTLKKSGYVNPSSPGTVFPTNTSTWYDINGPFMFFGFNAMSSSLKRKALISCRLRMQYLVQMTTSSSYYIYTWIYTNNEDFNPSTLTYNNKPTQYSPGGSISCTLNSGSADVWATGRGDNPRFASQAIKCGVQMSCSESLGDAFVKTILVGGGLPYLEVTYDEATTVRSQVENLTRSSSGSQNPALSASFTWSLGRNTNDGYCADENWTQASAKFYWRVSGASSWNTVNISGATTGVTIPAATFPPSSTIECYVQATDTEGTTSSTSTMSFSTAAVTLTLSNEPSGNSVDSRPARTLTWTLKSGSYDYPQSSATFYWRVSGASGWQTMSVSGNTKSLTIPAYRFPSDSTIEWYFSCTPSKGSTITTSQASFKTLAFTLTVTNSPTGSNQDTRLPKTFAWTLRNTQGDVTQSSSNLYWRVSGASNYTQITNATATKSITVPANTFPTGSTIQWYVDATAADGTVKTTSATTFSTVSPRIEATQYPSGSNVFSGEPITFKWHFTSAAGDYDQTSAVFYWRSSTSDPYTSVSISGNTQQVTIPANTFPTNSTIYWYLSGTASGGNTTTTSVTNFKTQTTQITPQNSPTSGYANPRNAITFSWYFAASGGSIPQQSATFYWRESGASSYTSVTASGNSVTIPANTFPIASTVQWYISGTDIGGTSSTSTVYSFSTTASAAIARAKSPINSGVDGSVPITFVWTLSSTDGFPASRVILEWKLPLEDDQHWHTIVDANEAITQYTVAADTFSSGEINWRVRAYNVDAVEGPESTASFICMVAPIVTALAASPVPFSVITWQANDQEAFQLEVDGKIYGTYFGQEKEFVMPDYFRDGIHEVKVRVLGKVELWSEWAETTVSIQNVPGANVELEGLAGVDVELEWETSNAEADFLIYRDGILIGHTENKRFVDRLSLGRHDYAVVNRLSSGNYSISETISRKTCVEYLHIETPDGSEAVSVRFRLKGMANPEHQFSRDANLNKLDGHEYPSLTLSNFRSHSVRLSAVFLYTEGNKWEKFQRLLGKAVIVKINDGTCCAAIIDSWNRTVDKTYYTAYEFTIRQIDWEDYDDTQ